MYFALKSQKPHGTGKALQSCDTRLYTIHDPLHNVLYALWQTDRVYNHTKYCFTIRMSKHKIWLNNMMHVSFNNMLSNDECVFKYMGLEATFVCLVIFTKLISDLEIPLYIPHVGYLNGCKLTTQDRKEKDKISKIHYLTFILSLGRMISFFPFLLDRSFLRDHVWIAHAHIRSHKLPDIKYVPFSLILLAVAFHGLYLGGGGETQFYEN
ncbi:hypothetical protein ACJX0J_005518 [Zea mays]